MVTVTVTARDRVMFGGGLPQVTPYRSGAVGQSPTHLRWRGKEHVLNTKYTANTYAWWFKAACRTRTAKS